MRIRTLRIENFRCIRALDVDLGTTTVFIGPNNVGKTAIMDAVRIVLTRRWGQRGSGFTEHDVHRVAPDSDPRTAPPVRITLRIEEAVAGEWDPDSVAALEDILALTPDGRNLITLRVTCAWSAEKDSFEPAWHFLNADGEPLPERRRATNLSPFFSYLPLFWLGPLRDASDEFSSRSAHWGRLLRSVRIPNALEADAMRTLADLDARIVAADPKLTTIANQIGEATRVAIGEGPGAARLNTLPLGVSDMLQRTGIAIRHEEARPWLPLTHHGQGLQSLAVIFLFQAAVLQQVAESERPGTEAVFAIEEPEAHLHPQAARTLWERVTALSGQKLLTTHSPHFVQNVPLRDLRVVRLSAGQTEVAALPRQISAPLPWTDGVAGLANGPAGDVLVRDPVTNRVAAKAWFSEALENALIGCYRRDPDAEAKTEAVRQLRHECRILPTAADEQSLSFHGRRVRGEAFFARRWILVEGVTEYLLVHAIATALGLPLDAHGVSVIDFQQSGSAGIYGTLGDAFGIPWVMVTDGDRCDAFRAQLLDRGFSAEDLATKFVHLERPRTIEAQLIEDGHGDALREILSSLGHQDARDCSDDMCRAKLENCKTQYMSALATRVAADRTLAERMPAVYVRAVTDLRRAAP